MTFKVSKDQLRALRPCHLDERLARFGKLNELSPKQAFNRGFSVRDALWVAGELGLRKQCATFAKGCAERVAHLRANAYAAYAADAADAADAAYAAYAAYAADAADAADAAYAAAAYAAAAYAADDAKEKEIAEQKKLFVRIFS